MEEILSKLLVADNAIIQQGTKELKEAFKSPDAILALCDILVSSANPQIRQTAAVVLRRKLAKKHQWSKVDVNVRTRIKQGMLQALVNEQEKLVKNSIAQFIGLIGKHEFPSNTWPEILQFINQMCTSDNMLDKEMGMYTLSVMTEISKGTYLEHAELLGSLFMNILNGLPDLTSKLAYYTIITMRNIASIIGGHQSMINIYLRLLPRVIEIICHYVKKEGEETSSIELIEILDELIEYAVNAVVPHARLVVESCLTIATDPAIETSVQIKAMGVVGWLIRSKSKVIQKNQLVEPIIDVSMKLMSQQPTDEVNEEYFQGDPDQFTTTTIAAQTLDVLALHVPPEKVVPLILTRVEPALKSDNAYAQKASYLALAILAEGCAEHIRGKYLEQFLKCIYDGIRSPSVVVRNAAFFALHEFSEYLQPEISQYASDLMPVFFDYLSQIFREMEQNKKEPSGLERMFSALQSFCLNLDDALLPYLPTLMERLIVGMNPSGWSLQLQRVALGTLESVAAAVKDKLTPYFPEIFQSLNVYITADPSTDLFELQSVALECLATILDSIEGEQFVQLAGETLRMALKVLHETGDPDVRRSLYQLFSALCHIIKAEIIPVLPNIMEQMANAIKSSEGITIYYNDEEKDGADIYDDLSQSENEDEEDIDNESESSDDSSQRRYTVENSYNDEKEQACLSLAIISKEMGPNFIPYIQELYHEIYKLLDYPQDDIRSAALGALSQFCITLHTAHEDKAKLQEGLQMLIPKCAEIIRCDEEQDVVIYAINTYGNLLEEIGSDIFVAEGHKEAVINCIIEVLTNQTVCQDQDAGEVTDDDGESEKTELLLECAGDVLPKFGNALTPREFMLYMPNVITLLSARAKNSKSLSQRSFAFGTLAECMKPLGVCVENFVPTLLQLWHAGIKDSSEEVRNNSVFGLGEMILHGKNSVFPHYNDILQGLSVLLSKESHSGTVDNICGAVAKMIITNPSITPIDDVFPVLLQHLPLKTDYQENEAVINCLIFLYQQGHAVIKNNMESVIKVVVHIYHNKQTSDDRVRNVLCEFIRKINADFPQEFAAIISSLGPEVSQNVQQIFAS